MTKATIHPLVWFIGAGFIVSVAGNYLLTWAGIAIPEPIDRLAFFIAGVVGGMLAKTTTDKQPESSPQTVTMTGSEGESVTVETATPAEAS